MDSPSPRMSRDAPAMLFSTRALHLALLLLCGCLLLVTGLDNMGLTDRDEGSNAGAAREMLNTGDWISPTLNGEPRYAKPAGTYWITSSIYALFGVHTFTARLQSALFGLALILLQYLFLHRTLGPTVALCGSLVLLLNVEFVGIHRLVLTDPALVFFTTLATYGFWLGFHGRGQARHGMWLFYIGMALATLAKGPVGILIPLLGVVPYLTLTHQWPAYVARGMPLLGWTVCGLIAIPWYLAMLVIHGAEYIAAAQANTVGRFANPMEGHGGTILFYVPILLFGFFPWSGFLPAALVLALKDWRSFWTGTRTAGDEQGLLVFCALWASGIFLLFSISATRLPHYILPLYPPAALLVATLWSRFFGQPLRSELSAPPPWSCSPLRPLVARSARGMHSRSVLSGNPEGGVPGTCFGLTVSTRIVLITGYLLSGLLASVPLVYERMKPVIIEQFPAAERVGVGPAPVVMGIVVFLGVVIFRHMIWKEARRTQAFWVLSGMTGVMLLIVILFALPRVGRYFIDPPQELATIAGLNLGPDDTLIHFGRKLPSLSFYAKRRVHFINPGEDGKFSPHVNAGGRIMVILQTRLREQLPSPVSSFVPILQRYGFVLLSSDPVLRETGARAPGGENQEDQPPSSVPWSHGAPGAGSAHTGTEQNDPG